MNQKSTEQATLQDATVQDDSSNTEGAKPFVSARELAMESIMEKRIDSLEEDGVDLTGVREDAKTNVDDQLASQLTEDGKGAAPANTESTVRVKVDGVEMDLPLSEVVKSYQKDAAASKRLQEATRLLQLAEEKASQQLAQSENVENNQHQPETDEAKEARRVKLRGAFSKLYEGDEDGAVEAMLEIVGESGAQATQNPQINTAAIAAEVRQQLDVESAYDATRQDYPELFAETDRGVVLGRETLSRIKTKEQQGIPKAKAVQESAAEVAALFGITKTGRPAPAAARTARDTKLERKANLDNLDSASVAAGNALIEEQNTSSVIQEMARARLGQQSLR